MWDMWRAEALSLAVAPLLSLVACTDLDMGKRPCLSRLLTAFALHGWRQVWSATTTARLRQVSLEPTSPPVPAAAAENDQDEDDDQKCRGIHAAAPLNLAKISDFAPDGRS
jgi:hypothetical protein